MQKHRVARKCLEVEFETKRNWDQIKEGTANTGMGRMIAEEKWRHRKEWIRLINHTRATGVENG